MLFFARNSFGIKLLYCDGDGETLRIASQAADLLDGGKVDPTPGFDAHASFCLLGRVSKPYTRYTCVRTQSAGNCLQTGREEISGRRFLSLSGISTNADKNPHGLEADQTLEALTEPLLSVILLRCQTRFSSRSSGGCYSQYGLTSSGRGL